MASIGFASCRAVEIGHWAEHISQLSWLQCSKILSAQVCPSISMREYPVICSAPSLQKTIFFCRSSTLTPICKPSSMSRQISGSSKADMASQEPADSSIGGKLTQLQRWRIGFFFKNPQSSFAPAPVEIALSGQAIGTGEPFANFCAGFILQVSSSGGGLPARLDLERDSGRSLFWSWDFLLRLAPKNPGQRSRSVARRIAAI